MISLRQLRYALAVERTLHFKKASEMCNISVSALSTALTEIEKQLGLQIFERNNKKVLVTPVGKEVLNRARKIMLQVEDLEHLADSQKDPLSFPITVGVIPTIAPFLLPEIFPKLNKKYPNAQITIIEEQSDVLVDLVKRGEIDTAILALPYPCHGLLTLEFWQEDFYWVTLKNEKYARQVEIASNEINLNDLMLLKEGHCLKDHALDVCKLPSQNDQHGMGATSLSTLIQMVLGGLGSTLIPKMALKPLVGTNKALSAIHLSEIGPHRKIAFIVRPNYTRLSSIEALLSICTQSLRCD